MRWLPWVGHWYWSLINLWARHMRGFGFWFSISTGLPNGHEWTILLLAVGLDCLKCKLSGQEISFFLPPTTEAPWLQVRGVSAKVKKLFHPSIFSQSGAYECTALIQEGYVWGRFIKDIKWYLNFAHFQGIFMSIFTEKRIKSLWKRFFILPYFSFLRVNSHILLAGC